MVVPLSAHGDSPHGARKTGRKASLYGAKDDVLAGKRSCFGRQYIIFCPEKGMPCCRYG